MCQESTTGELMTILIIPSMLDQVMKALREAKKAIKK
jgi:hypothetical protein